METPASALTEVAVSFSSSERDSDLTFMPTPSTAARGVLLLLNRFEKNAGGFLLREEDIVGPLEVDSQLAAESTARPRVHFKT